MRCTTMMILLMILLPAMAPAIGHEGGIRFDVGVPDGEFGETVDNPGYGLALHYGVRPVPMLVFGAGLDALIYGSVTRHMEMTLVEDIHLRTLNNLGSGYLFAQFRPFRGPVQPYAEARIGQRYLWTQSHLEDRDWWDDEEIAHKINFSDFAAYSGWGYGLLLRLNGGDRPGVYLDFKVTHMQGDEAEYLTEDGIRIVQGRPIYAPERSDTDLTTWELGVALSF